MITPFSVENKKFTDAAHAASRSLVYPSVFDVPESSIAWADHDVSAGGVSAVLDGQLGIDRTAKVTRAGYLHCFETVIQERFRRNRFAPYRDITVTEMNRRSGLVSELYKLKAGIFTYGYFDSERREFGEVVVVNVETLVDAIAGEKIKIGRRINPRTDQTFVTVRIDALLEYPGMVRWHKPPHVSPKTPLFRARPYWSGASSMASKVQSRLSFMR